MLKLYLLTRNREWDYDEFDSLVVAAKSPKDAIKIGPDGKDIDWNVPRMEQSCSSHWEKPGNIVIECIGTAAKSLKRGCVHSSFRAG